MLWDAERLRKSLTHQKTQARRPSERDERGTRRAAEIVHTASAQGVTQPRGYGGDTAALPPTPPAQEQQQQRWPPPRFATVKDAATTTAAAVTVCHREAGQHRRGPLAHPYPHHRRPAPPPLPE